MTDKPWSTGLFGETERQSAELAAMRRMLVASRGTFSLSVAICNSPALRDLVIRKLHEDHPDIFVVSVPPGTTDVLDIVRGSTDGRKPSGVFVVDLEKSLPSSVNHHPTLQRLDGTRELWKESYECPVVFWVPEYVVRLLVTEARDLWAWRSHQFEFVSELAHPMAALSEQFAGDLTAADNLDAEQKQFRIAELHERIAAAGIQPPEQLVTHVLVWLNELAFLLWRTGRLDEAERTVRRFLEISQTLGDLTATAIAHGSLGILYAARGHLDASESMHRKALEKHEALGHLGGIASAYENLGMVRHQRAQFDGAEHMYRRALEIHEKLGDLVGLARAHGNLGGVLAARGDLDRAEMSYRRALEMNVKLGRLGPIATQCTNLGDLHIDRGNLDEAERMYRKALGIWETLGYLAGAADACAGLGIVFDQRGDLEAAEAMHRKALEINQHLGRPRGMAVAYGNLGNVLQNRGDLVGAEAMYREALTTSETLGDLEGVAKTHANLAGVYRAHGEKARARKDLLKARELYERIGVPHMVAQVQRWLDELDAAEQEAR